MKEGLSGGIIIDSNLTLEKVLSHRQALPAPQEILDKPMASIWGITNYLYKISTFVDN